MSFFKKLPTAAIVLTLFAIFFVSFGIYQISVAKGCTPNNVIEVENGKVQSENQGKNISVTGKLTIEELPTDDFAEVKVNSIALVRTVEMYQYYLSNDTVYEDFFSKQMEDIEGSNDEEYDNPIFPDTVNNTICFAKAKIGDMVIGEEYLNEIIEGKIKSVTSNEPDQPEVKYLEKVSIKDFVKTDDGYFTNGDPENSEIGDIRIRYEYIDVDDIGEITVCGYQKDGKLIVDSDSFCDVYYKTTLGEIKEKICAEYNTVGISHFVIAAVMLLIAGFLYFKKNRRTTK